MSSVIETLGDLWITPLSDRQQKVLALISIPPSLLSIVSSCIIIYLVVKSRFDSTYRRILFGFSIIDVYASITYIISPLLLPRETSSRIWAFGNAAACSFTGASFQFSFGSYWYYGSMSFYFLLVIKFGISQSRMIRAEIVMHVLSIGYPLITSIIGAILGVYGESELGRGCWVANYKCEPDGIPCQTLKVGWAFGGVPFCCLFIATIVNHVVIYRHVKETVFRFSRRVSSSSRGKGLSLRMDKKFIKRRSSDTYVVPNQILQDSSEIFPAQNTENKWFPFHRKDQPNLKVSAPVLLVSEGAETDIPDPNPNTGEDEPSDQQDPTSDQNSKLRVSFATPKDPPVDDQVDVSVSDVHPNPQQARKRLSFSDLRSMFQRGVSWNTSSELNTSDRSSFHEPNVKRVREVATQSFLYVAAFFVTYLPGVSLRILESFGFRPADEDKVYFLVVIAHICLPLIGFFNLMIYIRPRYLRTRSEFPNQRRAWAIRRALYGEAVQPSPSGMENSNFVRSNSLAVSQAENIGIDDILFVGRRENVEPDPCQQTTSGNV